MTKNPTIDMMKGVLILLVMGGHAMELADAHGLVLWIGSGLRMPLMLGISGYLLNVSRIRNDGWAHLLNRYAKRMLLPWLIATVTYVVISRWPFSWHLPFDLLLRPPFHLWYIPVLFFLIFITRLVPFRPFKLLVLSAPFSLTIMYAFGLGHGPIFDGPLAPDSRFLRYFVYFFFGMLVAQGSQARKYLPVAYTICACGLIWWCSLYAGGTHMGYISARLLMCLGLIALLPITETLRLDVAPLNAIGRDSLFFYLWHPMAMAFIILTGVGTAATLLFSILLLLIASRLFARHRLPALALGIGTSKQREPQPNLKSAMAA